MLIHFLSARTYKAHCTTFPLRVFAEPLRALGITVKYYFKSVPQLAECDVLCVEQEAFYRKPLNRTPPNRFKFLEEFRKRVDTLIWFDSSDSVGKTSFVVMPFVDLYAKCQLLKDRSLYTRDLYNDEYYLDYYYQNGVEDNPPRPDRHRPPIQENDIQKLTLSWNLGLGDWFGFRRRSMMERTWKIFSPWPRYAVQATDPAWDDRKIAVSFRGGTGYEQAGTRFHREETVRQLRELANVSDSPVVFEGKLPYHLYYNEMRQSRIVSSPFGNGEICFRDFECFSAGAALYKPDMSHLESWPDYFEPNVTYAAHAWDFSDFKTRLLELLESPDMCQRLARNGQERYLQSLSPAGGMAFARYFFKLMQTAATERNG